MSGCWRDYAGSRTFSYMCGHLTEWTVDSFIADVTIQINPSKIFTTAGFVRSNRFYGKKAKDTRYQLSDHYSLFYFRLMNDYPGEDPHDWHHCADLSARRVWNELAFESLCLEHIPQIKQKLGISGVYSEESVWSSPENEELGISAAQIDLFIERRDQIINLCEIKYSTEAFVIDKAVDLALRNKISAFRTQTKTKNNPFS